ncbi:MAG: type IV pilus biogenesis protein PilM [Enterobacteriaceae bacterium]
MRTGFRTGWQVGLDIQSDSLRAIAVQRQRYGWQLRHWWHYPLPPHTFRGDQLLSAAQLTAVLAEWRTQLPRRFSLRIALPATLVLQQRFPLPTFSLSEEAMGWYAESKLRHFLPLAEQKMALDYRTSPHSPEQFTVTATRAEVLQQWLHCLLQARLEPQVVDIVPAILRAMAQRENLPSDCLLLHQTASYLLWVAPWQQELQFATYPLSSAPSFQQILAEYQSHSGCLVARCCVSASDNAALPAEVGTFHPFSLLQQIQPPLPAEEHTFTLAMGLALRHEEELWNR